MTYMRDGPLVAGLAAWRLSTRYHITAFSFEVKHFDLFKSASIVLLLPVSSTQLIAEFLDEDVANLALPQTHILVCIQARLCSVSIYVELGL